MRVGYSLINITTQDIIQQWGGVWGVSEGLPAIITLPTGEQIHGPYSDTDYFGYMLVEWDMNEPCPVRITRRQCALQLLVMELITSAEAIAMAQMATPPAFVDAQFQLLSEPELTTAYIDFAEGFYSRNSHVLPSIMEANGMTSAQLDAFFIAAVAL